VQMCMSTPGLGFLTQREEPRHQLSRAPSFQNAPVPMQIDAYSASRNPSKPMMRRPPPKFDMDLRDLFPEDLEPSSRPSHSFPQPLQGVQRSAPAQSAYQQPFQHQQQQQPSPRQPQLSPASSINSQINTGLGMGPQGTTNNPLFFNQPQPQSQQPFYMQNTYNPDFMSSLPGMDFLNNIGSSGDEINFDAGGLDLGFGMGLDYQHDWSDSQQYDLFDGFFFGNGIGGYGNANGNGNGNGNANGGSGPP